MPHVQEDPGNRFCLRWISLRQEVWIQSHHDRNLIACSRFDNSLIEQHDITHLQFIDAKLFLDPFSQRSLWWNCKDMECRSYLLFLADGFTRCPAAWRGQKVLASPADEYADSYCKQRKTYYCHITGCQPLPRGCHVLVPSRKAKHPSCRGLSMESGFHVAASVTS